MRILPKKEGLHPIAIGIITFCEKALIVMWMVFLAAIALLIYMMLSSIGSTNTQAEGMFVSIVILPLTLLVLGVNILFTPVLLFVAYLAAGFAKES